MRGDHARLRRLEVDLSVISVWLSPDQHDDVDAQHRPSRVATAPCCRARLRMTRLSIRATPWKELSPIVRCSTPPGLEGDKVLRALATSKACGWLASSNMSLAIAEALIPRSRSNWAGSP